MKYRAKSNLLEFFKASPFFTKEQLFQLAINEKSYNLKKSSIDTYISRFLKSKELIKLKRGVYVTSRFYNNKRNNSSYIFYLANVLKTPSYITSWTALQYYNLTTDVIQSIISVTPKVTINFRTKIGTFNYQSIKKNLFKEYILIKGDYNFFIATPSKALFDLLYFRTRQFRDVSKSDIMDIIDDLRINYDEMSSEERKKFEKMIRDHYDNK